MYCIYIHNIAFEILEYINKPSYFSSMCIFSISFYSLLRRIHKTEYYIQWYSVLFKKIYNEAVVYVQEQDLIQELVQRRYFPVQV